MASLQKEIDALYDLPVGEFVAARDALAKRLRKDDSESAGEVKALRKPSVAAAAVNHALRAHPKARKELLQAGIALRKAQENVRGKGGRDKLRKAGERERAAVNALTDAAAEEAGLSPAAVEKARETLHAAALDDHARDLVSAARLERELEAVSVGPLSLAPAEPDDEPEDDDSDEKAAREAARAEARQAVERARAEVESAREAERDAENTLRDAKSATREARKELSARERELKKLPS